MLQYNLAAEYLVAAEVPCAQVIHSGGRRIAQFDLNKIALAYGD